MCKIRGCIRKKIHAGGMCVTHYRRWWRKKHPLKSSYQNLRSNAKRRGKEFTITFAYFCKFAIECRLMLSKKRTAYSHTVDRIDNELGYVPGNLQMLTMRDNVVKQRKLEYDYQQRYARVITLPDPPTGEDTPF